MDWLQLLESPTQVAVFGVLGGVVTAISAIAVALINNWRKGGGVPAPDPDTASLQKIVAAIEALNSTLVEQNRLFREGGEMARVMSRLSERMDDLCREVGKLVDRIRG